MSEEHRVSDSEREAAVVALREASTAGRLTLEELSDRTGLAYVARTQGELVQVTADLPAARAEPLEKGRGTGWMIGLFVPVARRGRWRVQGRTIALSLFAPCLLDFRAVSFPHAEATLVVVSLFGPVKITLPKNVDADLSLFSLFAPVLETGSPESLPVAAPRLRVRGVSLFGPVLVQHRHS